MTYSIVALDAATGDLDVGAGRPFVGEPRPFPPNWDEAWQGALQDWMSVENLEERAAAPGWIDPRVLAILRSSRSG